MNRRMKYAETYRELTSAGVMLCLGLGGIAEVLLFKVLGICREVAPVCVLLFIWILLGIMVSRLLFAADAFCAYRSRLRQDTCRIQEDHVHCRHGSMPKEQLLYCEKYNRFFMHSA